MIFVVFVSFVVPIPDPRSPIPDPYDPIRTVTPPVNRHTDGTSSMCLK